MFYEQKKTLVLEKMKSEAESAKHARLFQMKPKSALSQLEKKLVEIKRKNEIVSVENFKELYSKIHKTNSEIRFF